MDQLFELLIKLFENNNVAGILVSICLLLTLLNSIGFFSFVKKVLKFFSDLIYGSYWNHQRKMVNKPLTDKQEKRQNEIKDFLLENGFINNNKDDKNFYYHDNLQGLNDALSVTIGKSHSFILTSKKNILTRTGPIDNQKIDNRCIIQLVKDLMQKGLKDINRSDYLLQQEEDEKEPKICKECKFFVCSGWNF